MDMGHRHLVLAYAATIVIHLAYVTLAFARSARVMAAILAIVFGCVELFVVLPMQIYFHLPTDASIAGAIAVGLIGGGSFYMWRLRASRSAIP